MIDVSTVLFVAAISGFFSDIFFRKFKKNGGVGYFSCYLLFGFLFLGGLFHFFIVKTGDFFGVSVVFSILIMMLGGSTYIKWREIRGK
jgi:hypothetical protein